MQEGASLAATGSVAASSQQTTTPGAPALGPNPGAKPRDPTLKEADASEVSESGASPSAPAAGCNPCVTSRAPVLKEVCASKQPTLSASPCAATLGPNPRAKPRTPTLKDAAAPDASANRRHHSSASPSAPALSPNPGAKPHNPKSVGDLPLEAAASVELRISSTADPNPTLGPNPSAKPRNPKVKALCSGVPEANPSSGAVVSVPDLTLDPNPGAKPRNPKGHAQEGQEPRAQPREAGPAGLPKAAVQYPVVMEIFAGTARVTAQLKSLGVQGAVAVNDKPEQASVPCLQADLATANGRQRCLTWVATCRLAAVFAAPPCGTCSRARELPNGPPPLRSDASPDGLQNLLPRDQERVRDKRGL